MGKWVWVCVLAGVMFGGCSDNKAPVSNTDAGAYMPGGFAGDGDGDGDTSGGDGDSSGGDGDTPAGDGDGDAPAGDGDGDGDAPAGDGDGDSVPGVPSDGTPLSSCNGDECNDGLGCFGDNNDTPGFCTETCNNDRDCTDIGGLLTLCNGGECAIDCSDGPNGTSGACPENMECNAQARCNYPSGSSGTATRWEVCSSDNECSGGTTCEGGGAPSPFNPAGSPGFCTTDCDGDQDCSDDGGAGGAAACYTQSSGGFGSTRYCVVECNNDKECPLPLVCNNSGRCAGE